VTALVRSELLKIRTTRGWYAYLILIVLLVGLAVASDIGSSSDDVRGSVQHQRGLVEAAGLAALLGIILGITITTTEFRHGTVTPTFLAAPHREHVIAAKAAAGILVGLLFAVLALVVVAAVALPWLAIVDVDVHFGEGEVARRAAQALFQSVLWTLVGVAVGALVHSQVAALVGTLIWIFLGETLLVGLFGLIEIDWASAYLPFQALDAADGTGGDDLLSYGPAVAVSFGWIALVGAAGIARTCRRDIT
jgi:ABC-2 type transport system permease protein